MSIIPVVGVKRHVRFDSADELRNQTYLKCAKNAILKSNGVCTLCGFKSLSFSRVLPLDNNYSNLEGDNLRTVCSICFESQRLSYAAMHGVGIISWVPELTQSQINALFHATLRINISYRSKNQNGLLNVSGNTYKQLNDAAKKSFGVFVDRQKILKEELGVSSIEHLASFLLKMNDSTYSLRHQFLKNVRYIPNLDAYFSRSKHWEENAYLDSDFSDWQNLLNLSYPELMDAFSKLPEATIRQVLPNAEL